MNATPNATTQSLTLHCVDGTALAARCHHPRTAPDAAVVILPALAVPQAYYRRFARFLADHGMLVLTFDHRGIGASCTEPARGSRITLGDWIHCDVSAALAWMHQHAPDLPLLGVGHSFGGQLPGLTQSVRSLDGLLSVAAQLGYYGHWPLAQQPRRWLEFRVLMPGVTHLLGYLPGTLGVGHDLPPAIALEWSTWLCSPHYLVDHVPGARERLATFDRPSLLLGFTDDRFAPPAGVRALAEFLPATTELRIHTPAELGHSAIGHFGYFRKDHADLWPSALAWLRSTAAAR